MLDIKIRVTKELYKAYDSYQRREKWIGKSLLNELKKRYITEIPANDKVK